MPAASRKVSRYWDAKHLLSNITEIMLRRYDDASAYSASFDSVIDVRLSSRQLRDGTLEENGLLDGARVILLPSVETGLLVSTSYCFETCTS